MKKLSPIIGFLSLLASASKAFAETKIDLCDSDNVQFGKLCGLSSDNFGSVISSVIIVLFVAAVVIALLFLIWGGIRWILSGGDKSAVESARNTIVAAVVGLVIVFLAYFILNIVLNFFLGTGLDELTLPTIGLE